MTKALIREIVLLIARLTDSTSAAILTIVSHKAYYAARRSRIHTGPEVPPDESGPSDRPSGFARMFQMIQVRLHNLFASLQTRWKFCVPILNTLTHAESMQTPV